jgi:hypothetical protein
MAYMNRFRMTIRILAVLGFGAGSLLLAADEPQQKAPAANTQRMDFPSGGALRFTKSTGILTVEAWDRPDVEITTIASSDKVRVTAARHGDELVVTTDFPGHRAFSIFDLEIRVKAPSTATIIAAHGVGEVNIDGLAGDIQVTLQQGEIMLHLPQEGRYDIHAKSKFGDVNSDFPGPEKRRWWLLGHRSVNEDAQAAHKLDLRVEFGDIVILKTRVPSPPGPPAPALKAGGL